MVGRKIKYIIMKLHLMLKVKENINVNSYHKQSVNDVANQFIVSAESNDETIE